MDTSVLTLAHAPCLVLARSYTVASSTHPCIRHSRRSLTAAAARSDDRHAVARSIDPVRSKHAQPQHERGVSLIRRGLWHARRSRHRHDRQSTPPVTEPR